MMTKGGEGVKNLKKMMTSFMNGPFCKYYIHTYICSDLDFKKSYFMPEINPKSESWFFLDIVHVKVSKTESTLTPQRGSWSFFGHYHLEKKEQRRNATEQACQIHMGATINQVDS